MQLPQAHLAPKIAWTFGGNVLHAASRWAAFSLIAKLTSPAYVGSYALGQAIALPVFAMANMNLRAIQVTDANHHYSFGDYFGARILSTALALGLCSAIASTAESGLTGTAIPILIAFIYAAEAISDVLSGQLQKAEAFEILSKSMVMKALLRLAGQATLLLLTGDLRVALLADITAIALVTFFYEAPRVRATLQSPAADGLLAPRFRLSVLARLALYAAPVAALTGIAALQGNLPRYFLRLYRTEYDVGIFAALAFVGAMGSVATAAVSQVASPRLARDWQQGRRASYFRLVRKIIFLNTLLGAAGVLGAWMVGPLVLRVLYTEEYAHHRLLFVVLMLNAGVGYLVGAYGTIATARHDFRVQLVAQVLAMTVSLPVFFWLTPASGMIGAAWATLSANVVFTLIIAGHVHIRLARARSTEVVGGSYN